MISFVVMLNCNSPWKELCLTDSLDSANSALSECGAETPSRLTCHHRRLTSSIKKTEYKISVLRNFWGMCYGRVSVGWASVLH